MPRILLAILIPGLLLAFITACGGDDDDTDEPSLTATTDTTAPSPSDTSAPDKETPPVSETTVTPAPEITDGPQPTAPPVNPEGTPAVEPEDVDAFIDSLQGQSLDLRVCAYNPSTALVNCADFGVYGINPPIVGQDITCNLWEMDGKPIYIQCRSVEPLVTRYYQIQ